MLKQIHWNLVWMPIPETMLFSHTAKTMICHRMLAVVVNKTLDGIVGIAVHLESHIIVVVAVVDARNDSSNNTTNNTSTCHV